MTQPQMAGVGAGISVPSALISFIASSLPVLQWIAAAVAIGAGLLSIYSWFKNK